MQRQTIRTNPTGLAILASCLVIFSFPGCLVGEKGSGVSKTIEVEVEDFDEVSIGGTCNMTVRVGASQSVKVTFDDNLIELVETYVKDGKLIVTTNGSYSTSIGLNVEVTVPSLSAAETSGSSDLTLVDFTGSALTLSSSGSSDVIAKGTVEQLEVNVSGSADAELKELVANNVTVSTSGAADAIVYAQESVEARASGSSDIEVHGSPKTIKENKSGAADIEIK